MDKYNLIPVLNDRTDGLLTMLFGKEFHSIVHSLTESMKKESMLASLKNLIVSS